MGFSRQEYWSGLPCPPPGNLPNPGIKPVSLALACGFSTSSAAWEVIYMWLGSRLYIHIHTHIHRYVYVGFPGHSDSKDSACNAGDPGLIPGLGSSPGEGNGNPLQYSCLEISMDRGVWRATVHGIAKSWTRLSYFHISIKRITYLWQLQPLFLKF